MREPMAKSLAISLYLVTIASFMALGSYSQVGLGILLYPIFLCVMSPAATRLDAAWPSYRKVTRILTWGFTLSLPAWFFFGGPVAAVLALVAFVQAHKLLHQQTLRDRYQLLLMGFLMLLGACSLNPDAGIGIALALFLVSGVVALLLLHIQTQTGGAGVITSFAGVPGAMTTFSSGNHWRGLKLWSAVLSLLCFIGMAVVFLASPRMELGFLQGVASVRTVSGIGPSVSLNMTGAIASNPTEVFRVRFPEEPDGVFDGPLYWRIVSYPFYFRSEWQRVPLVGRYRDASPGITFSGSRSGEPYRSSFERGREVRQQIEITRESLPQTINAGIAALAWPLRAKGEGVNLGWSVRNDFSILAMDPQEAFTYDVWSEIINPPEEILRACTGSYGAAMQYDYQSLVSCDLSGESRQLARDATADAVSPYEKALAIQQFLGSSDFLYTLDPPSPRGMKPTDHFLLHSRRGHCELFASAMALMLRASGIPSRLAVGFLGGEWDENDKSYVVRNDMAHTWVEVYFVDYGWVAFDPSPSSGAEMAPKGISRYWANLSLQASFFWYRNVLGYKGGISPRTLNRIASDPMGVLSSISLGSGSGMPLPQGLLVSIFVFAGALLAFFIFATWILKHRAHPHGGLQELTLTADQTRAKRLFRLIKSKMFQLGTACDGHCADEICYAATIYISDEAARSLRPILESYKHARFGGAPMDKATYHDLVVRVKRWSTESARALAKRRKESRQAERISNK